MLVTWSMMVRIVMLRISDSKSACRMRCLSLMAVRARPITEAPPRVKVTEDGTSGLRNNGDCQPTSYPPLRHVPADLGLEVRGEGGRGDAGGGFFQQPPREPIGTSRADPGWRIEVLQRWSKSAAARSSR